ncbi:MAG: hypothetical protein JWO31_4288 [Phycisphaerales bacterium]|nr:hypothetical protein [Phycisphaerales bacterium]
MPLSPIENAVNEFATTNRGDAPGATMTVDQSTGDFATDPIDHAAINHPGRPDADQAGPVHYDLDAAIAAVHRAADALGTMLAHPSVVGALVVADEESAARVRDAISTARDRVGASDGLIRAIAGKAAEFNPDTYDGGPTGGYTLFLTPKPGSQLADVLSDMDLGNGDDQPAEPKA